MVILFYGQPASGKTTLADAYVLKNWEKHLGIIRIDGDKWRDITKNKDYSKEGRIRNLKGAFDMALYLEQLGYTPILSFVTPYDELRQYLKDNSNKLIEVYLEYSEDRGRTSYFAKDFEIPTIECLKMNTSDLSIDECVNKITEYINKQIYVG
jgi:adenylylsulfate kinase